MIYSSAHYFFCCLPFFFDLNDNIQDACHGSFAQGQPDVQQMPSKAHESFAQPMCNRCQAKVTNHSHKAKPMCNRCQVKQITMCCCRHHFSRANYYRAICHIGTILVFHPSCACDMRHSVCACGPSQEQNVQPWHDKIPDSTRDKITSRLGLACRRRLVRFNKLPVVLSDLQTQSNEDGPQFIVIPLVSNVAPFHRQKFSGHLVFLIWRE